jgi:hypothetical protein
MMARTLNSVTGAISSIEAESPRSSGPNEGHISERYPAGTSTGPAPENSSKSSFTDEQLEEIVAAAPERETYDFWLMPYDPNDEEEVALYLSHSLRNASMPDKTVADKLFVQKAKTIAVINDGPANAALVAELPAEKLVKKGPADLVIYFANSQMELQKHLPKVKERLEPKGALWVAYVKGTSKLRSDLHRDTIREYGESIGLTSVAMISIDEDWSALRLKIT